MLVNCFTICYHLNGMFIKGWGLAVIGIFFKNMRWIVEAFLQNVTALQWRFLNLKGCGISFIYSFPFLHDLYGWVLTFRSGVRAKSDLMQHFFLLPEKVPIRSIGTFTFYTSISNLSICGRDVRGINTIFFIQWSIERTWFCCMNWGKFGEE